MTYPTYDQIYGSEFQPENGVDFRSSDSGFATQRNPFGSKLPGTFIVKHLMTEAQKDNLLNHYDTKRQNIFAFYDQNDEQSPSDHTAFYAAPPQVEQVSPSRYLVTVRLVKVT